MERETYRYMGHYVYCANWIKLASGRVLQRVLVERALKPSVTQKTGNLISYKTLSFSKELLFHAGSYVFCTACNNKLALRLSENY